MEDILFGPNFTAICIKPGRDPEIISMKNSLLSIHEILNVDCYGNRLPGLAEFEVKEILYSRRLKCYTASELNLKSQW